MATEAKIKASEFCEFALTTLVNSINIDVLNLTTSFVDEVIFTYLAPEDRNHFAALFFLRYCEIL